MVHRNKGLRHAKRTWLLFNLFVETRTHAEMCLQLGLFKMQPSLLDGNEFLFFLVYIKEIHEPEKLDDVFRIHFF